MQTFDWSRCRDTSISVMGGSWDVTSGGLVISVSGSNTSGSGYTRDAYDTAFCMGRGTDGGRGGGLVAPAPQIWGWITVVTSRF